MSNRILNIAKSQKRCFSCPAANTSIFFFFASNHRFDVVCTQKINSAHSIILYWKLETSHEMASVDWPKNPAWLLSKNERENETRCVTVVSLLHKVVSVVLLDFMQVSSVNYGKTRSHLASKYSWWVIVL